MEIQHFGHQHTLTLYNIKDIGIDCSGCKLSVSGFPAYGCRPCKYFLHQSCAEMPLQIQHPFHPSHPLNLLPKAPYRSKKLQFKCFACQATCSGFTYHCYQCLFDLDILCARFTPISHDDDDNNKQIHHFTHPHPLILVPCYDQEYGFNCSMCEQPIKGSIYACVTCRYFIHKSCAECPQNMQHPYHPQHPLTLLAVSKDRSEKFDCYACGQISSSGYTFNCSDCRLDLHIDCAKFISRNEDNQKPVQHFSHSHPLMPMECSKEDYRYICFGCDQPIKGSIYFCSKCKFFVHKSCIELPREIHHFFHPQHSLTLLPRAPYRSKKFEYNCYACEERCFGFTYHCSECKFYLDVLCSRYKPPITQDENQNCPQIEHFAHQHPLILVTCYDYVYKLKCSLCNKAINDSMYVCAECKFFLHKSCLELPQQIQHPFHPLHPLILHESSYQELIDSNGYRRGCHACHNQCSFWTYRCSICKFYLDIKCSVQMLNIESECHGQEIQHFSHQHPLIPFDVENSSLLCAACTQLLDGSIYICHKCIFAVHKKCAELPGEMQHPFHPQHPLTVVALKTGDKELCKACGSYQYNDFAYNCAGCGFHLDLECASLQPTIRYERHEHLLLPMERHGNEKINDFRCSTCGSICRDFFVRCVPCNLNLHVKCIPALPDMAKHSAHRHPLTLSDPLPKDDSNEYYCDACEEERNPHHFVYYCAECEFVAHIDCAVPEVIKALPAVGEESYVARQVREAGFILSDSDGRKESEDSEDWEEDGDDGEEDSEDWEEDDEDQEEEDADQDADQDSEATDSSLAALDKEIAEIAAKIESLKQERARHILMSNKECFSEDSTSD